MRSSNFLPSYRGGSSRFIESGSRIPSSFLQKESPSLWDKISPSLSKTNSSLSKINLPRSKGFGNSKIRG